MYIHGMSNKYSMYIRRYLLCMYIYVECSKIYICILYGYTLHIQLVKIAYTYDIQYALCIAFYIYIVCTYYVHSIYIAYI